MRREKTKISNKIYEKVKSRYIKTFREKAPSITSVKRYYEKGNKEKTFGDRPRSGRPKVRLDLELEYILFQTEEDMKISSRILANYLDVSQRTILRRLEEEFHMKPYKIRRVPQRNQECFEMRLNFAKQMLNRIE